MSKHSCQCGCGQDPGVYTKTRSSRGHVKGAPRPYFPGHHSIGKKRPGRSLEERFWEKVDKNGPNGCWLWTASGSQGYGRIRVEGKPRNAHRVSYELLVGPIPDGLVLDHLCRNTACVNPDHLEPVTDRINILRGEGLAAQNAVKTHCKHGHEFTPDNTAWHRDGYRVCRACSRRACNAWYRRNRAKAVAA